MHKLYRPHSFYGSVICVNLGRLFGVTWFLSWQIQSENTNWVNFSDGRVWLTVIVILLQEPHMSSIDYMYAWRGLGWFDLTKKLTICTTGLTTHVSCMFAMALSINWLSEVLLSLPCRLKSEPCTKKKCREVTSENTTLRTQCNQ